jgi:4-hydroxy-tetrahydrodipicolinate reductase
MKIALLGYGKMGKEIEQIALKRGHEVILRIDRKNAASLTAAELGKADAVIEFTVPESAVSNIYRCFEANVPVVVGTTGWLNRLDEVKVICAEKGQGLFYASNFSVGVNIFFRVNTFLAKIMNHYPEYDVSLEEIHHMHKLDAPSGTGLSLAKQVLEHIERKEKWVNNTASSKNELALVSKREGEVPGTHIVDYDSDVDRIEIKHIAHNRKGFAFGAVLAAEFMKEKKGVFGMEDLLKI